MDLKLESREGVLLAMVTGRVSFREAVECWKTVCDAAARDGCDRILCDWLGAEGVISDVEKYEISKIIVEYCQPSLSPTVAVVGKPPTITGFGALVASNRGLMILTFPERQAGLDWLMGFGSKATSRGVGSDGH